MNDKAEMADYEARAEAAYAAMYEAAPHNVNDFYEDARLLFGQAIQSATALGLIDQVERLKARNKEIEAVYNHQFRYVGR